MTDTNMSNLDLAMAAEAARNRAARYKAALAKNDPPENPDFAGCETKAEADVVAMGGDAQAYRSLLDPRVSADIADRLLESCLACIEDRRVDLSVGELKPEAAANRGICSILGITWGMR